MQRQITSCIEINDSHVKFLQAKVHRNQTILTTCEVQALKDNSQEEAIRVLNKIKGSKGFSSHQLALIVPRRHTILKRLQLPSVNSYEIKKMIELQLMTDIPYSMEQVSCDYELIDQKEGYSDVLVMIAPLENVQSYLNICQASGLTPRYMILSSMGLLRCLDFEKPNTTPLLFIDVDLASSEMCFCHEGQLLFSRHLPLGVRHLDEDCAKFLEQMALTLAIYQKQNMGPAIKEIYLASSDSKIEVLKQGLEKEWTIPIKFYNPTAHGITAQNINLSQILKNEPGISLNAGLGALLTRQDFPNLIPREIDIDRNNKHKQRQRIQHVALAILIFIFSVAVLSVKYFKKRQRLEVIEKQIAEIHNPVEDAQHRIQLVQSLEKEFVHRIFMVDMVHELYELMPPDISLKSLSIDEKTMLTIQGYAQTSSSVNSFQASLLKNPHFKDINLQFATKRQIFNQEVSDFKLTARYQ